MSKYQGCVVPPGLVAELVAELVADVAKIRRPTAAAMRICAFGDRPPPRTFSRGAACRAR